MPGLGRLIRAALPLLVLLAAGAARAAEVVPAAEPHPVPAVSFTDQDGHPLDLGAFKGKVVVLDYWATWCAPCKAEFPLLDSLQGRMEGRGLVVVAVSLDRGGRRPVDKFYDETHVAHLGKYLDPSSSGAQALGLQGVPTTLIIDRQGREVARVEGSAAWDSPDVAKFLDGLLGTE